VSGEATFKGELTDDEMPEADEIARDLRSFLAEMRQSVIQRVEKADLTKGQLELIRRAVVVRQHEALVAVCDLVLERRGHIAVTLLRPACEEFISIRFLRSLKPQEAEDLLLLMVGNELHKTLTVQHKYSGDDLMTGWGLAPYLATAMKRQPVNEKALKAMKKRIGWSAGITPSVSFMAKRTNSVDVYELLYYATSRTVHFNVVELLRRAWKKQDGEVTVSSSHYERYWALFSLSWGWQLYAHVVADNNDLYDDEELTEERQAWMKAMTDKIGRVKMMPIITEHELKWE
jgi:hypothetical protein